MAYLLLRNVQENEFILQSIVNGENQRTPIIEKLQKVFLGSRSHGYRLIEDLEREGLILFNKKTRSLILNPNKDNLIKGLLHIKSRLLSQSVKSGKIEKNNLIKKGIEEKIDPSEKEK